MIRFIVLTTQRSGSTFLCRSLNRAPRIHCMGECFWSGNKVDHSFPPFLKYVLRKGEAFEELSPSTRRLLVRRFLDAVCTETPGIAASGLKVQYDQFESFPEILPWMIQRSVCVVHLLRRNLLKRTISWIIKTKGHRSYSFHHLPQDKIQLQCHTLIPLLEDLETQCERYRQVFSPRFPYLEVFYEDYVAFRERETARIGTFLGIGPLGYLTWENTKLNSDRLSDIVTNYDEVVETLSGTPFARFLDEYAEEQYEEQSQEM